MTRPLILLVVAAMTVTSTAVAWSGKGTIEPSTHNDRADGYMYPLPDVVNDGGRRVYFNGYLTDGSVVITPESPNSATLGTQITTTSPQPVALLGVWKDCNKDGYIGNLDNVGFEYRSLLLSTTAVCPIVAGPYSHNDGTWVREFLPIVWGNETAIAKNGGVPPDNFTFVDSKARIWADKGHPKEEVKIPCHLYPQASGTYHSTGGVIALVDCQLGYAITDAANGVGSPMGFQIGFNDVQKGDQANSDSLLNQRFPLGESSDASHVDAVDCAEPAQSTEEQRVGDPTGAVPPTRKDAQGNVVYVSGVDVYGLESSPSVGTEGSLLGTANKTERETLHHCGQRPRVGAANSSVTYSSFRGVNGKETRADNVYCPENMADLVVVFKQPSYACEVPYPNTASGRIRPDIEFYSVGPSQRVPHRSPPNPTGDPVNDPVNQVTYEYNRAVNDPIVAAENQAFLAIGGYTSQVWMTFDKVTFQFGPNLPPQYITYHAYVSVEARSKYGLSVPATEGAYGAEACVAGLSTFDCDRSHWWKDAQGNDIPMPNPTDYHQNADHANQWGIGDPRTFLNDPFNLRDVDCYDQGIAALRDEGLTPAQVFGQGCV